METIREALLKASSCLEEDGVEDSRHNAEQMLMHALGWERSRLLLDAGEPMPHEAAERYEEMVARRAAGEPLQYITGEQEFYGLRFEVTPAVLIPRPETELLVEAIAARARHIWGESNSATVDPKATGASAAVGGSVTVESNVAAHPLLLADIGTGSGAIALTLLTLLPGWRAAAVDLSPAALQVAARNGAGLGVSERVTFWEGDLLGPLLEQQLQVDVLVSNPPYIESADVNELQREVRDYEPRLALDGGLDGLRCYREIVGQIGQMEKAPRLVGFEVGLGQAREVAAMLDGARLWEHVEVVKDYAGIERHVLAWR